MRPAFARIPSVRKIPTTAWVLALVSSGLQILIFPKPSLFFLCWIALVPLLYALLRGRGGEGELIDSEGRSLRPFTLFHGFVVGWAAGLAWDVGSVCCVVPGMYSHWHSELFLFVLVRLALFLVF